MTVVTACAEPRYPCGDASREGRDELSTESCATNPLGRSQERDGGRAWPDADLTSDASEPPQYDADTASPDASAMPLDGDAGPGPCVSVPETCNGLDDDCDGHVDNGAVCGRRQLVAGSSSTCLARADGAVSCWGDNELGQLGDGTTETRLVPTPALFQGAAALALTVKHVCALSLGGVVSCWGDDASSQLGGASFPNEPRRVFRTEPREIGLPLPAVGIAVGLAHSCAVLENGAVTCWGARPVSAKNAPQEVPGFPERVLAIASGYEHACALLASRGVVCWGENGHGELGDGTTEPREAPVSVLGLTDIVELAAGGQHACALSGAGDVWCWGFSWARGITNATPTLVPTAKGARRIAVGLDHMCAVSKDRDVLCWGSNKVGELGDGSVSSRWSPVKVVGLTDAVDLALGTGISCAMTASGEVSCWGANFWGALGDGTTNHAVTPVKVLLNAP